LKSAGGERGKNKFTSTGQKIIRKFNHNIIGGKQKL